MSFRTFHCYYNAIDEIMKIENPKDTETPMEGTTGTMVARQMFGSKKYGK